MSNGDKYFATLPPDELASNLMKKLTTTTSF
jgi:hypothetical protein